MPHPRRKSSIKPYGLNPKTTERLRSQTHKQTNKPGWKVWKICRPWNEKGHVLESCPKNVNKHILMASFVISSHATHPWCTTYH